jgi:hypothetical protein
MLLMSAFVSTLFFKVSKILIFSKFNVLFWN